jgi:hypothetical protein
MPERMYVNSSEDLRAHRWGALWAGMFGSLAIWSIFGFLGLAIFSSAAKGTATEGMYVAMGIWSVVLTIISMFVGGRIAGSGRERSAAWTVGTVVLGLSMTALLLVAFLVSMLGVAGTTAGTEITAFNSSTLAGFGWVGFVSLLLGWLGAVSGAMSSSYRGTAETVATEGVRRAA